MFDIDTTFRAYAFEQYGNALQVIKLLSGVRHEPLTPTQVRIRVHASALNPADYKFAENRLTFVKETPSAANPFRIGFDVAGTLVEVGADVKHLDVGDAVYGMAYHSINGTHAEYVVLDAEYVSPKPKTQTFTQAAGVSATAGASYQALAQHAKVQTGERVLVLGGSSATGAFGIQIAKALGATVVATTSTRNVDLVKSFGADQVIDYTTHKWGRVLDAHSVDVIYNCGVEPDAWDGDAQTILKRDTGRFVTIYPVEKQTPSPINATLLNVYSKPTAESFRALTALIESGKLVTPIDSVHAFEDLLVAIEKQMTNHTRGKVILQVLPEQN